MKISRMLGMLACTSGMLLTGALAQAQPYTFTSVANGPWRTASTWDRNSSYPQAGDTVIIDGETVTISLQDAAMSVTVSSGQLRIEGSGSPYAELEFPASSSSPSLVVTPSNGVVLVANARVEVSKSMSFTGTNPGTSSMQGLDGDTCEIVVNSAAANVTLTLDDIIVHGALQFLGTDSDNTDALANNYQILADVQNETLLIGASLESITSVTGACGVGAPWKVAGPSANRPVLRFAQSATLGYFYIDGGALTINSGVTVNAAGHSVVNSGIINQGGSFGTFNSSTCP